MCTPGAPKLMLNCAAAGRARKDARTLAARMDLRMMDLSIEAPAWAASAAASVRWRTGRKPRHRSAIFLGRHRQPEALHEELQLAPVLRIAPRAGPLGQVVSHHGSVAPVLET